MRCILGIVAFTFLLSCGTTSPEIAIEKDHGLIGISKLYPDSVLEKWLLKYNHQLKFVELYGLQGQELDSVLGLCDGILLSGGADISTALYKQSELDSLCGIPDLYRDSMEMASFHFAFRNQVPLLGICRGMQLMNVATGGNLTVDIPLQKGSLLHQTDSSDAIHPIILKEGSILALRTASIEGEVNSNHHQSVDSVGSGFDVIAFAEDGIPEALHFTETKIHPFLLAVQWHPERMDYSNPLSREPAKLFLLAIEENLLKQQTPVK
jgi:putative glutamine amidotransferase